MSAVNIFSPDYSDNPLNDADVIWRYIPLRTLLLHLAKSIFIPSVNLLRNADPLEGRFHFGIADFNTAFHKNYGKKGTELEAWIHDELCSGGEQKEIEVNRTYMNHWARIMQKHYFDFMSKTRYAWCWFQSPTESALMWNSYGHQGAAIGTTIGKLRVALEKTDREFLFGRMQYIPLEHGEVRLSAFGHRPQKEELLLKPYFLKRSEYEGEREVRFVTSGPEVADAGILLSNFSPVDWITKIRLWPGLKPAEIKSLQQIVHSFVPSVECLGSDLFGADPTPDTGFVHAVSSRLDELYMSAWKDGSDKVPQEMKQL